MEAITNIGGLATGLWGTFIDQPRLDAEQKKAFEEAELGWAMQQGMVNQGIKDLAASQLQGYQDYASDISGQYAGAMAQSLGQLAQNTAANQQAIADFSAGILPQYGELTQNVDQRFTDLGANIQQGYGRLGTQVGNQIAGLQSSLAQGYGALGSQLQQGYGDLSKQVVGGYQSLSSDIGSGYDAALQRNMQYLEGAGTQEKKDIAEAYVNAASRQASQLSSTGLGGSTITSSVAAGTEREKQASLARTNERLQQQRLGLDVGLTQSKLGAQQQIGMGGLSAQAAIGSQGLGAQAAIGSQALGARQQLGQYGIGQQAAIGSQALGAEQAIGQSQIGAYGANTAADIAAQTALGQYGVQQGIMDRANFAQAQQQYGFGQVALDQQLGAQQLQAQDYYGQLGYQYSIPMAQYSVGLHTQQEAGVSPFLTASQLLQSFAPPPEVEQPGTDWLTPTIGAVGSVASAKLMFPPVCIDQDAIVNTPQGDRRLGDLVVGDLVESEHGEFQRVVCMDMGMATDDPTFVKIKDQDRTIIATTDHIIDGSPAGDRHDAVVVTAVPCGDILLEDGSNYIANGFTVTPMFEYYKDKLELPPVAVKALEVARCRRRQSQHSRQKALITA